ncbi:hypothetical protein ACOZ38_25045 [Sphaerisporangium viridialbum]|uniref:hypothetical protein n=1 Tax=Sphaerisporangium viridialbum TaxID=46189 RepID=UPI003C70F567
MLGLIFGGLFAGLVFYLLGHQFVRYGVASKSAFILMALASIGLIPLTVWVVGVAKDFGAKEWQIGLGGLCLLAFFGLGVWLDVHKDKKIDHPKLGLLAGPVAAVLFLTGAAGLNWIQDQAKGNTDIQSVQSKVK